LGRIFVPEFDLVLFGATGFTGRLVAEHVKTHAGPARWAIAGRNREKLEKIKGEIGVEVPILIGDSSDPASLSSIVSRTKVICSTVGPYAKYGTPLVERCVEAGVSYCDLSGEPQWIHEMIRRFSDEASGRAQRSFTAVGSIRSPRISAPGCSPTT
jgi:short subunit dehydrogenase-like uncharacterized protein